jgi:dynein heavy chain
VDDITAVVIILLEGNPKDKSWGAAQKLMNNVDKFMERLRGFKAVIDQGQVRCYVPHCLLSKPSI